MKRVLCVLLALCLLLGALPMAAGARGTNRYTDVLQQLISQRIGSKNYGNMGLFYDLDGDGIEEMLIVRTIENTKFSGITDLSASLYTIVDGEAVNLLKDDVLYTDVGGPTGYMAVVEKGGKTCLAIFRENGGTSPPSMHRNGSCILYSINRLTGSLTKTNTATYGYVMEFGNKLHDTSAKIDGKAVSYNQYLSWVKTMKVKATVNYTEKKKYTFEDLLKLAKADDTGDLPTTTVGGFRDVRVGAYYADSVLWAVDNGITSGIGGGKFAPAQTCKREQIVTFLYRSKGSPDVAVTDQFTDMPKSQEFQKAISWAVENGITMGNGKGRFLPEKGCTRAEAMTFIWRAAGKPEPKATAAFEDMPSNPDFSKAISWAVENNITSGIGNNKFGPNQTCKREHIVTFLYKAKDL